MDEYDNNNEQIKNDKKAKKQFKDQFIWRV